jgi:hypothetical protein
MPALPARARAVSTPVAMAPPPASSVVRLPRKKSVADWWRWM